MEQPTDSDITKSEMLDPDTTEKLVEPPSANSNPEEVEKFKPGWRLLAAFTSIAIVNLACALDATIISVALPVSLFGSFNICTFLSSQLHRVNNLKGNNRRPQGQRNRSFLGRNIVPSYFHRLAAQLGCFLASMGSSPSPSPSSDLLHSRLHRLRGS